MYIYYRNDNILLGLAPPLNDVIADKEHQKHKQY